LSIRTFFFLAGLMPALAFQAQAASITPSSLTLTPGQAATVTVSNIKGTLTISNSKPSVASAVLASPKITVKALTVGSTTVTVKDKSGSKSLKVTVNAPPMTVSPTTLNLTTGQSANVTVSNPNGTVRASSSNSGVARATVSGSTVIVQGIAAGRATVTVRDSKTSRTVNVTVTGGGGGGGETGNTDGRLLASNCFQCHGTNGSGGFEKLLGETEAEIFDELVEYASGQEDADGIMAAHTRGYTEAQLRAIAKYLANLR
jgi:sulfide dehydrogenase cytochrome subunit